MMSSLSKLDQNDHHTYLSSLHLSWITDGMVGVTSIKIVRTTGAHTAVLRQTAVCQIFRKTKFMPSTYNLQYVLHQLAKNCVEIQPGKGL